MALESRLEEGFPKKNMALPGACLPLAKGLLCAVLARPLRLELGLFSPEPEKLWFKWLLVCCRIILASPMKAYVYVSLKRSVLDPQGKTIQGALQKLGYQGLQAVRQGKFFELTLDGGLDKSQAESAVGKIAREVLTNPVIEEFRYSIEE